MTSLDTPTTVTAAVDTEPPRIVDLERRIENLVAALDHRDTIGKAKGILIAHFAVTDDEAFSLLVRLSQTTNRKLRTIAADLVDRMRELGPATAEHCQRVSGAVDRILADPPAEHRPAREEIR